MGLLLGAVVGLWPFQHGVAPNPGDVWNGVVLTTSEISALDPAGWPVQFFTPDLGQVFGALGLVTSGLVVTLMIARLGGGGTEGNGEPDLPASDSAAAG